jgi:tetratricopeptide (TPR) repeat protein
MTHQPSLTSLPQPPEQTYTLPEVALDTFEALFQRATVLAQNGRIVEAKAAYLEVLSRNPAHFGALIDLGNLLYATGFRQAATRLYREAVRLRPENARVHVNLANALFEDKQTEEAKAHFETALRLEPGLPEANRGLAYLYAQTRDDAQAAQYREKAFAQQPVLILPYCGEGPPVELLVLVSACGGVIPMRHHFDEHVFRVTVLFVEFFDLKMPLPTHHIVMNAMGDADLCYSALEIAAQILAKTDAPVINLPAHVLRTGRVENARALARIPHVVTPRMSVLPRKRLETPEASETLAAEGFAFPLLLRAPGYHTGDHFLCVETPEALPAAVASLPGPEILVIEYLDTRGADGKIRKYRAMMIGGALYPLHAAVSQDWKIHFFTAEMADHPAHRAEDAAFLADMSSVLGPQVMQGLEEICWTLHLDYGGIDFGLSPDGKIVLYEANASMAVHAPDADARWDYRRPSVQRILDAIRQMLTPSSPSRLPAHSV